MATHNPYESPSAVLAENPGMAPPPKPWSVTIVQVVGAILASMLVVGLTRYFYGIWSWHQVGVTMIWEPLQTGFRIVSLVALIVMLYQLPKRSQIGRWCGVLLLLAAISGVSYVAFTTNPSLTEPTGQLVGHILSYLVCLVPSAWLLYALAFSRKARAYFGDAARN